MPQFITMLYEDQPLQCRNCGRRFPASQQAQLDDHYDWHFRMNRVRCRPGLPVSTERPGATRQGGLEPGVLVLTPRPPRGLHPTPSRQEAKTKTKIRGWFLKRDDWINHTGKDTLQDRTKSAVFEGPSATSDGKDDAPVRRWPGRPGR